MALTGAEPRLGKRALMPMALTLTSCHACRFAQDIPSVSTAEGERPWGLLAVGLAIVVVIGASPVAAAVKPADVGATFVDPAGLSARVDAANARSDALLDSFNARTDSLNARTDVIKDSLNERADADVALNQGFVALNQAELVAGGIAFYFLQDRLSAMTDEIRALREKKWW